MDETNWIDCLAEGTWQADNGNWVSFTKADLDAIASSYKPTDREAPLVFGHPKTDDPALGWATRFQVAYDEGKSRFVLQGKFKQVPDDVKSQVDEGRYAYISMALFSDKKTVRHVGLLGAAQPASYGNRRVSFTSDEKGAIVFKFANQADRKSAAKEEHMEKIEQLQSELAAEKQKNAQLTEDIGKLKIDLAAANTRATTAETNLSAYKDGQEKKTIEARIDKLVETGKLDPAEKPEKLMVALSLAKETEEIELSAGEGKKTKLEIYLSRLEAQKDNGLLGHEFSAPDKDGKKAEYVDLTKHV